MQYELYIDILFLENFMMDSLLLLSIKRILQCKSVRLRAFAGGALGAFLTCAVIVLPFSGLAKMLLFHMVINTAMLLVGLKIQGIRQFLKAAAALYFVSFLFGGIMGALRPYVQTGSWLFASAVVSYYLIQMVWMFLTRLVSVQRTTCDVTLYGEQESIQVRALVDTGNTLTDSLTGDSVCVLEKELAFALLGSGFRYIPYRTVEGESIMAVFRIRKMCIHLETDCWVERPLIGISENSISEQGTYQMILNPDIVDEEFLTADMLPGKKMGKI